MRALALLELRYMRTMGALEAESGDPILGMSDAPDSGSQPKEQETFDTTPDGGLRAWLVVLGGFLTFFVTFGQSPQASHLCLLYS